ncbi:hypothetical protein PIB30_086599 [Stylosanthes scabra]|uniref:Retrotransposon Copia-like N-terminal domain-containing protein n=1 Tax=Stylosanthes scabra TaxID=79078 RepID=A0ABU6UTZ9_9FABA|nr:hypothetical protein [Stylosanthes scabra]
MSGTSYGIQYIQPAQIRLPTLPTVEWIKSGADLLTRRIAVTTFTWYQEHDLGAMTLILANSNSSLKNSLIPIVDKLDESNFSTWSQSVLLNLRTVEMEDHLNSSKIPQRFDTTTDKE